MKLTINMVLKFILNWIVKHYQKKEEEEEKKEEDDEDDEEEEEDDEDEEDEEEEEDEEDDEEEEEEDDEDEEDYEEESEEEKAFLSKYAKRIKKLLNTQHQTGTHINAFTYTEIDGLPVDILVRKEKEKQTYMFIIRIKNNIIFLDKNATQINLLEWNEFRTITDLLKTIKIVKRDYKLIEHTILSPQEIEYMKMQRIFFPIPTDKNCSVCYEFTSEYTVCCHPICFRCRYKCIASNKKTCPICREGKLERFPSELTYLDG